jgi:hypothetical protein
VAKLSYAVPTVGEKNTVAEPKVDTALTEIKKVVNGELNSENLEAGGVNKTDLSASVQAELNSFVGLPLESKKSIIATEQEREATTYGVLTTPDEVEVVVPANGLIAVAYQALWQQSAASAGRAALFVGTTQLKVNKANEAAPVTQAAGYEGGSTGKWSPLFSCGVGLVAAVSGNTESGADVTTGQIVGGYGNVGKQVELGGTLVETGLPGVNGGPAYIFAAGGTYKISVRFKASSGKVIVKNRKLWAWVIG